MHRQAKVFRAASFTNAYVVLRELSGRDSIRFEGSRCSAAHLFGDFWPVSHGADVPPPASPPT